jgi:hypothetical protein
MQEPLADIIADPATMTVIHDGTLIKQPPASD